MGGAGARGVDGLACSKWPQGSHFPQCSPFRRLLGVDVSFVRQSVGDTLRSSWAAGEMSNTHRTCSATLLCEPLLLAPWKSHKFLLRSRETAASSPNICCCSLCCGGKKHRGCQRVAFVTIIEKASEGVFTLPVRLLRSQSADGSADSAPPHQLGLTWPQAKCLAMGGALLQQCEVFAARVASRSYLKGTTPELVSGPRPPLQGGLVWCSGPHVDSQQPTALV